MNEIPPRQKFAALLASNRGRVVAGVTSLAAWAITQLITSKGLQLPGELALSISAAVGAAAGWLVDMAGARLNNTGISQIQDALPGVKTDGAALGNGQTADAVRMIAGAVLDVDPAVPVKPASVNEIQEFSRLAYAVFLKNPALLNAFRQTVAGMDSPP